jgi:hypothetical protein
MAFSDIMLAPSLFFAAFYAAIEGAFAHWLSIKGLRLFDGKRVVI